MQDLPLVLSVFLADGSSRRIHHIKASRLPHKTHSFFGAALVFYQHGVNTQSRK